MKSRALLIDLLFDDFAAIKEGVGACVESGLFIVAGAGRNPKSGAT